MANTTTTKTRARKGPAWAPQAGRSTTTKSLSWDPTVLKVCLDGAKSEKLDLSTYVMRELRRLQLGRTKISELATA